jgi:hypothetical protein
MSALITYKQTLNLKNGLILDEKGLRTVYKNVVDVIKNTKQFNKDSKPYISIEGVTNIGEVKAETIDDFLSELLKRQLNLRSIRIYCNFNSYSKEQPYSYTVDAYFGRLSDNLINIHGSDEDWIFDSKEKLDFYSSKIPVAAKRESPFIHSVVNLMFNGKLLLTSWILVVISILFSRFFPNIYWTWASVFVTAYAIVGVSIQVFLYQEDRTPAVRFVLGTEKEEKNKESPIEYVQKQSSLVKIIFYIFGFVGFLSAIMQIIDIAKRFNWIR